MHLDDNAPRGALQYPTRVQRARDYVPLWPSVQRALEAAQPSTWRGARETSGWFGPFHCPWREDRHPSLYIKPDDDGPGAWKDHGTDGNGSMADLAQRLGLDPRVSFDGAPVRQLHVAPRAPLAPTAHASRPVADDTRAPHDTRAHDAPPVVQTLAQFCEARGLDADRLRSVWGVIEGAHSNRPALLYPVPNGPRRVKYRDGGKPKYTWERKGGKGQWYGLANVGELPAGPLYIVNGEPSVWAAQQAGVRAVCIVAGEGAAPTPAQVATLRAAGYGEVRVVYDADDAGVKGARKCVAALQAGEVQARAYRLPADIGEHGDVDDVHRRTGDAGLAAALAALELLPEPAPVADLDTTRRGPEFKIPGSTYYADGSEVYALREGKDGSLKRAVHLPWCPTVLEHVYIENAEPGRARHYLVRMGEQEEWASWADLKTGEVWERFAGAAGAAGTGNTSMLHNLVAHLGLQAPRLPGFDTTGWHQIDGRWHYVYLDGRTEPPMPDGKRVHVVDVPPALVDTYTARTAVLDAAQASPTAEDIWAAVQHAGQASPQRYYVLIALAAAARALLYGITPSKTTVLLEGPPGHGKTGVAGIARGLVLPAYVDGRYAELSTGTFNDTAVGLENKVAREASMPMLIDDLAIPDNETPANMREHQKKVDMVVRSVFNEAPMRDRSTRDLKPRPSRRVWTLPFLTAQTLPPDTDVSVIGRAVLLQVGKGDVDTAYLREHGPAMAAPILALGRALIAHYAARVDREGMATVRADLERRHADYERVLAADLAAALGREIPQESGRLPGGAAYLLVGAWALDEQLGEPDTMVDWVRAGLVPCLVEQVARIEKRDGDAADGPASTLMHAIADRIARGVPISGSRPWRIAQRLSAADGDELAPVVAYPDGSPWPERAAGWHDGQDPTMVITAAYADATAGALYLTPTWRTEMRALAKNTPGCTGLGVSDVALGRALEKEGWLVTAAKDGVRARCIRYRGRVERVWPVRLDMFLGGDGEQDAGDSAGADDSSEQL